MILLVTKPDKTDELCVFRSANLCLLHCLFVKIIFMGFFLFIRRFLKNVSLHLTLKLYSARFIQFKPFCSAFLSFFLVFDRKRCENTKSLFWPKNNVRSICLLFIIHKRQDCKYRIIKYYFVSKLCSVGHRIPVLCYWVVY